MEIKIPQQLEISDEIGDFETKKAGIDESSMPFLFEMMSKNLYSNPIGSIVREIASNCFDSHNEANVEDAVIIGIHSDEEGNYISFKDSGVGLSPERIDKVYMNYFSSTKRDNNNQIGGFGLGSKTPLSYTDYFYIITVFDNVKYQYLYSKGLQVPTLTKLIEEETTEKNGTEIKIYIKTDSDLGEFVSECRKQLSYFDNIYFTGKINLDNNYTIFENDLFKFRTIDKCSEYLHIVYGKVYYPIDFNVLGINSIKIPIGLKFDIGELLVTPNREALRYTPEIIELVKQKIDLLIETLSEKFEEQNTPYEDLLEWLNEDNTRPHLKFFNEEKEYRLYLTGLGFENKIKFKPFVDLKVDIPRNVDFFGQYKVYSYKFGIGVNKKILTYTYNDFFDILQLGSKFILSKNFVSDNNYKNKYICKFLETVYGSDDIYAISKRKTDYKEIFSLLKQDWYHHYSNRQIFGKGHFELGRAKKAYAFIKIVKDYVEKNKIDFDYDNFEIPVEFIKQCKKEELEQTAAYQRKLNKKIIIKDYFNLRKEEINTNILDNFKNKIVIYGSIKDKDLFYQVENIIRYYKEKNYTSSFYRPINLFMVAETNFKYFKNKKNMVNIKDFYSDNRIFNKVATSFKIELLLKNLLNAQNINIDNFIIEIKNICEPIGNLIQDCLDYRDKFNYKMEFHRNSSDTKKFKNNIIEIAEKNNLFDKSIDYKIIQIENWFNDVEILKFTRINEDSLPAVLKYLKDKKKKLNLEYYSQIIHKKEIEEGQLSLNFDEQDKNKLILKKAS